MVQELLLGAQKMAVMAFLIVTWGIIEMAENKWGNWGYNLHKWSYGPLLKTGSGPSCRILPPKLHLRWVNYFQFAQLKFPNFSHLFLNRRS